MEDQGNHEFNSVVNILNDLAKGQKMMMELMGQLASHTLERSQKKEINNGKGLTTVREVTPALLCRVIHTSIAGHEDQPCHSS